MLFPSPTRTCAPGLQAQHAHLPHCRLTFSTGPSVISALIGAQTKSCAGQPRRGIEGSSRLRWGAGRGRSARESRFVSILFAFACRVGAKGRKRRGCDRSVDMRVSQGQ